jgi:hypothetical protein
MAIAVYNLAKDDLSSEHLRKQERIKCKRQLIVLEKLVGELEMIGDKVGGRTSASWWYPFNGLQTRFCVLRAQSHVNSDTPARFLTILVDRWINRAVVFRNGREQAF